MTQHDRPETAGDFLRVWYVRAEADNTSQLEQWESQFPALAEASPDMTLEILRELSTSNAPGAKEPPRSTHASPSMPGKKKPQTSS